MPAWDEYARQLDALKLEIEVVEEMYRERRDALYSQRAALVRRALAEGYTQAQIADYLGVSHAAVQKIRRRLLT